MKKSGKGSGIAAIGTRTIGFFLILAAAMQGVSAADTSMGARLGEIGPAHAHTTVFQAALAAMGLLWAAVWLLFLAPEIRKGILRARIQAALLGISLFGFGVAFWLQYPGLLGSLALAVLGLTLVLLQIMAKKEKAPPLTAVESIS